MQTKKGESEKCSSGHGLPLCYTVLNPFKIFSFLQEVRTAAYNISWKHLKKKKKTFLSVTLTNSLKPPMSFSLALVLQWACQNPGHPVRT